MELQISKFGHHAAGALTVSADVFNCDYNESLIHQVVVAHMAKQRQGTKAQKSRSDVRGGGAKPWRQKGTGRARAGTIRSPLWRTGGVTFAARPRDFAQKVNKRMYRKAVQSILSELLRQERLITVQEFTFEVPKTKALMTELNEFHHAKILIVINGEHKNLELSARNIPNVSIMQAANLNPVKLISADKILVTVDAIKKIEELLG